MVVFTRIAIRLASIAVLLACFACGGGGGSTGSSGGQKPVLPIAPGPLRVSERLDVGALTISWDAQTPNPDGYELEVKSGSQEYTPAHEGVLSGFRPDFTYRAPVPLVEGATLRFRLRSVLGGLRSAFSPELVTDCGLKTPTLLDSRHPTSDPTDQRAFVLQWAHDSALATTCRLERGYGDTTLQVSSWETIFTGPASLMTYTDIADGEGVSVSYRISLSSGTLSSGFRGVLGAQQLPIMGVTDLAVIKVPSGLKISWRNLSRRSDARTKLQWLNYKLGGLVNLGSVARDTTELILPPPEGGIIDFWVRNLVGTLESEPSSALYVPPVSVIEGAKVEVWDLPYSYDIHFGGGSWTCTGYKPEPLSYAFAWRNDLGWVLPPSLPIGEVVGYPHLSTVNRATAPMVLVQAKTFLPSETPHPAIFRFSESGATLVDSLERVGGRACEVSDGPVPSVIWKDDAGQLHAETPGAPGGAGSALPALANLVCFSHATDSQGRVTAATLEYSGALKIHTRDFAGQWRTEVVPLEAPLGATMLMVQIMGDDLAIVFGFSAYPVTPVQRLGVIERRAGQWSAPTILLEVSAPPLFQPESNNVHSAWNAVGGRWYITADGIDGMRVFRKIADGPWSQSLITTPGRISRGHGLAFGPDGKLSLGIPTVRGKLGLPQACLILYKE